MKKHLFIAMLILLLFSGCNDAVTDAANSIIKIDAPLYSALSDSLKTGDDPMIDGKAIGITEISNTVEHIKDILEHPESVGLNQQSFLNEPTFLKIDADYSGMKIFSYVPTGAGGFSNTPSWIWIQDIRDKNQPQLITILNGEPGGYYLGSIEAQDIIFMEISTSMNANESCVIAYSINTESVSHENIPVGDSVVPYRLAENPNLTAFSIINNGSQNKVDEAKKQAATLEKLSEDEISIGGIKFSWHDEKAMFVENDSQ